MIASSGVADAHTRWHHTRRHYTPASRRIVDPVYKGPSNPVLIRIFKEEHQLELWRQNDTGTYELVKTYIICKFSGHLGPKLRQGDRQAPEGFYSIAAGQLRHEHRMDIGYPNEFDRANGRTGNAIQIHGGCSSIGCFAITNDPIIKIYNNIKKSLHSGQKVVQVQAYPFRMTDVNLKEHSLDKNIDFWQQLKTGYDLFEQTKQDLTVHVVDRRYIIK